MSGDLSFELRPLAGNPADLLEVQRVLELASDYANAIQGAPFDPLEATRTFKELPPRRRSVGQDGLRRLLRR